MYKTIFQSETGFSQPTSHSLGFLDGRFLNSLCSLEACRVQTPQTIHTRLSAPPLRPLAQSQLTSPIFGQLPSTAPATRLPLSLLSRFQRSVNYPR